MKNEQTSKVFTEFQEQGLLICRRWRKLVKQALRIVYDLLHTSSKKTSFRQLFLFLLKISGSESTYSFVIQSYVF